MRRALHAFTILATLAPAPQSSAQQPGAPSGRILGVVFDSMAKRPLAGAVVQLATVPAAGTIGVVRVLHTDSTGRYQFDSVGPGTYLLGFQHVAVDSLGLLSPVQRLDIRSAATVRTAMAVPSVASIVHTVCGQHETRDSLGVMLGSVRDARADTPIAGAFVSLRWGEVVLTRGGAMQRSTPIVDTFANEEGWYTACVPGGVPVTVRASHETDVSGNIELSTFASGILRQNIYIGHADASQAPDDTSASGRIGGDRIIVRGEGQASGFVRALNGQPIPGARVALLNGANEARTNERGEFTLSRLPQGTHTIEARAVGYVPGQAIVNVVAFRRDVAELVLEDVTAYLLDPVRVAAVRRLDAAARVGFERRRRMGSGYFLDESVLDTIRAMTFKDLVRRIPGLQFVRGRTITDSWREHIEFTLGGRSEPCLPVVYLDGAQLLQAETDLDGIIHPGAVRRIEVYHRPGSVPAEFRINEPCGVIAIWTGPRRSR
ncbi:MAG TPA: carboxypeptidase regulatory-like domain-containing protein [Gemmatimonadaceae bacterium]